MRSRYYHVPLDLIPEWGSILGFEMVHLDLEWIQAEDWWQLMLVTFGGVLSVNGVPNPFNPGSLLIVPPGARCRLQRTTTEDDSQWWFKFRPNPTAGVKVALPQAKDLGTDAEYLDRQFREALDYFPICRKRMDAIGWALLWSVGENPATMPEHPGLAKAEQLVQSCLSENLTVQRIAEAAEMSPAQLTRQFRQQLGQTPLEYVKSRRMHLACDLLLNSEKSIKEIAVVSGFPDLQRFNKAVRETFGCAPRELRITRPQETTHVQTASAEAKAARIARAERPTS